MSGYLADLAVRIPGAIWKRMGRRVTSVPGLHLNFSPAEANIGDQSHPGVCLEFVNNTGAVVYLAEIRIAKATKRFPRSVAAVRDVSADSNEIALQTADSGPAYDRKQAILQTDGAASRARGFMATTQRLPENFYADTPRAWRHALRQPKYFGVEFFAVVGRKPHLVFAVH